MRLENLPQVHPRRYAERVEHQIDGRPVRQVGHIFGRHDLGDDALVAVPVGELVALDEAAFLRDVNADHLLHTGFELHPGVAAAKAHGAEDDAAVAGRNPQGGVFDLSSLFAEDRAQQPLFRRRLGLALERGVTDQDVALLDLGPDSDDAVLVEVAERGFREAGDVAGDLFRAEFGVPCLFFVLFDVDARVGVRAHKPLRQHDGVLEVVAVERHNGDEHVLTERQPPVLRGGAVGDDLTRRDSVPNVHERTLVQVRVLVRALETGEQVLLGDGALVFGDDPARVDVGHGTRFGREQDGARVAGDALFDPGTDKRRVGADQRHGLRLHIRAHQGAVGVVVL